MSNNVEFTDLPEFLSKIIATSGKDMTYGNDEDIEVETPEISIHDFFKNIKSDKVISTFTGFCGIEGFTLAYGNFLNKSFMNVDYKDDEKDDHNRMLNDKENYQKILRMKYGNNIHIYRMPCCWNKKTFNSFIGVNIYPFLWTKCRYYLKEKDDKNGFTKLVLESANDRWIMKKEDKEKLLKELSQINRYQLPKNIKEDVNEMRDTFLSAEKELKDTIYLSTYSFNDNWRPVLNEVYQDLIREYSEIIKNETGLDGTWCLLPNDCYFCT